MLSEDARAASPLTFQEWFEKPVIQPLTTSETLGWNEIALYTSRIYATKESVPGPVTGDHGLVFVLSGSTRLQSELDGKFYDEYLTTGAIGLVPAWHESFGHWSASVTSAFINLSPQLLNSLAETAFRGDPAHVHLLPRLNFHDPLLQHLIGELCEELQNPSPLGTIFAESASQTIMLHLLRKYSTATVTLHPLRAKLTERQLRVVDDYIESNLDRKISLTELASLLFMSQSHFERLFRVTMGCAPYHYVLDRKIERARWLLSRSAMPLHQVAEQCGFANQSHFTRHFTHQIGVSPARFRDGFKDQESLNTMETE
jgi:AraC family transcriptional regulator